MALLKQSTTYTRLFLLVSSTDHVSPKTGATVTVNLSKAGGTFAAAGGTITEVANGWYKIALTTTDTNTLGDLAFNCTATGADNTDFADQVVAIDLTDGVRLGLTALPNAAAASAGGLPTSGTGSNQIALDSSGRVTYAPGEMAVKKNTALANFAFLMISSTDHVSPKTGLTITATRSIDGAAFAGCANAAAEVGNGIYVINLANTDLNGNVITFLFTGSGADSRYVTIVTQA